MYCFFSFFIFSATLSTPAAAASEVNMSMCDWMPFLTWPGWTTPGHLSIEITRTPPS